MAQDTSFDVSWALNSLCTCPPIYVVVVIAVVAVVVDVVDVVVVVVVELAVTSERGNHHKSCDLLRVGSNDL